MAETIVNNPFVVGKYLSDSYFWDRQNETKFLRIEEAHQNIIISQESSYKDIMSNLPPPSKKWFFRLLLRKA